MKTEATSVVLQSTMGFGDESTSARPSKPTASTQETPSTPSYPDWSTPLQGYYGPGATPPPFFTSPVASSPTPHPYLWGSQHLITPYGTPLPYPALYPHGGLYAHPNMAMSQGAPPTVAEMERKAPNEKNRTSIKKSKGSSGNTGGKPGERGKAASGSGNDGPSQSSGESGSEDSSAASDQDTNQQELTGNKKRSFDQMLADVAAAPVVGQEGFVAEHLWIQDERELKKQRRKQSNRESARRSRLRKQAECEELQSKVETLSNENRALKDELRRLAEECTKLTAENNYIMEELVRLYGPDAVANLETNNTKTVINSTNSDGGGNVQATSRGGGSVSCQKEGNFFNSNGKLDSGSN